MIISITYITDRMLLSRMLEAADHPYLVGKGGRIENNSLKK